MTLNDILYAITCRLDELYPGCTIYTNRVEKGLEEPCFFVNLLEPSRKPMLGGRSFQQNGFCIQYFPAEKQGSHNLLSVLSVLMDGMEYISISDGSLLHGTNRSGRIEEGILNFFIPVVKRHALLDVVLS